MSRVSLGGLAFWMSATVVLAAGCGFFGGGRDPNESRVDGVPLMRVTVSGQAPALNVAWSSVPGATEYDVVVLDAQGRAAWSWSGSSASVVPPRYAPIPVHGTASVAAFGSAHKPLGLSDAVKF